MVALVEAEMETLEEQNPKNKSDYDDDDRMSIEMEYDGGDESDEKTLLYRQLTFADMVVWLLKEDHRAPWIDYF